MGTDFAVVFSLLGREAMGYGEVPTVASVNLLHLTAKQSPVGRGVVLLVVEDVVMNHLMDKDIVKHALLQIVARAHHQGEVAVAPPAKQAPLLFVTELAQKAAGRAEFEGRHGEPPLKHLTVIVVEFLSQKGQGHRHKTLIAKWLQTATQNLGHFLLVLALQFDQGGLGVIDQLHLDEVVYQTDFSFVQRLVKQGQMLLSL